MAELTHDDLKTGDMLVNGQKMLVYLCPRGGAGRGAAWGILVRGVAKSATGEWTRRPGDAYEAQLTYWRKVNGPKSEKS